MSEVLENKSKKKSDLSKDEAKVKKVNSSKSEELNTEKTKSKTGNKTSNKPESVKKVKENGNVTVKETVKKTVKENTKQTPTQKISTDRKTTSKAKTGEASKNKVTSNKSSANKTTDKTINTRKIASSKASTNKTDTNKISTNKVSTNKTKQESKINSNAKIEKDKLKKVDDKQKNQSKSTTKSKQQKNNTNQNNKEKVEETETNNLPAPESKFDTVSLKEIREALQNKVNDNQKQKVVKKVLINIGFAMVMIVYLIVVALATKNIELSVLEKDLKIITLGILVLGIGVLERAYKKDNSQMAINAVEILIFGAINLCMMYAIKINFIKLGDFKDVVNNITYIGSAVAVYYILKSIIISVKNVRKFKKENNDIKEIIKK